MERFSRRPFRLWKWPESRCLEAVGCPSRTGWPECSWPVSPLSSLLLLSGAWPCSRRLGPARADRGLAARRVMASLPAGGSHTDAPARLRGVAPRPACRSAVADIRWPWTWPGGPGGSSFALREGRAADLCRERTPDIRLPHREGVGPPGSWSLGRMGVVGWRWGELSQGGEKVRNKHVWKNVPVCRLPGWSSERGPVRPPPRTARREPVGQRSLCYDTM